MSYATTRRLILAAGLGVLLLVSAVMYFRGVDRIEVLAVLLYIPVFLGFVFWDLVGGAVAAIFALVVYAVLRGPAIDQVGAGQFLGPLASRGVGYLAFGLLGGWADRALERSLEKLDVYDQVDDETGLFNARFFVQDTGLEMARAGRYKTFFSVCVVDVPIKALDVLARRKRVMLMRDLGYQMKEAIRSVDRAVHARDDGNHRFAVICPETGTEGATVFVDRLAERLDQFLEGRGAGVTAGLARVAATFPGDDERLPALREAFAAINRMEHPEHPVPPLGEGERVL